MTTWRLRCDEGHLICDQCHRCACRDEHAVDDHPPTKVSTDHEGRALCAACRKLVDW